MTTNTTPWVNPGLRTQVQRAREAYAACLAGQRPWWDVVVITASSQRQAGRYEEELALRQARGQLPNQCRFLVAPDLDDQRIGSGGATLNALRVIGEHVVAASGAADLSEWWTDHRALLVHSGGDSRRMPQWSSTGKLFSPLPVTAVNGETSTVFDELLALSTPWVERADSGLAITSGDVVLVFDAEDLHWHRPGVCGVAMAQPLEVAARHGVYVIGEDGRVYTFLQKPSAARVRSAGGELEAGLAAVDVGILKFDAGLLARVTELAGVSQSGGAWRISDGILAPINGRRPFFDLYEHFTMGLTGAWQPGSEAPEPYRRLACALRGVPFHCDLVEGLFQHVGTTALFREVMTSEESFAALYEAHQRIGRHGPSEGAIVIDCVFEGPVTLEPGVVALECHLRAPVAASRGAILHGLRDIGSPLTVPAGAVAHQLPIAREDGLRGFAIEVYGVEDDPKTAYPHAAWLDRSLPDALAALGLPEEAVWEGVPRPERTLWNALLFPVTNADTAWQAALWLMGEGADYSLQQWRACPRISLAEGARWMDQQAQTAARLVRAQAQWRLAVVQTCLQGGGVEPFLPQSPGARVLRETADELRRQAEVRQARYPTQAAALRYQAGQVLVQAGLAPEAETEQALAFATVRDTLTGDTSGIEPIEWNTETTRNEVIVTAPVRIDLVGGWSDTPPFCLDWGGAVLNAAINLDGLPPVRCIARRIPERRVRLISEDTGEALVLDDTTDLGQAFPLGSPFAIPLAALRLAGFGSDLRGTLERLGSGIELWSRAAVPVGSGLGASSIVAAAVVQGVLAILGSPASAHQLCDLVLGLEQAIGAGGGWQDQAGAIFPGLKLLHTGPGLPQRVQPRPIHWSDATRRALERRLVLYYTGIRRVAQNILREVVGRYLAREPNAIRVLHEIRHAAVGGALALEAGDLEELGRMLDLQWRAKVTLDPNAANAPINRILDAIRPFVCGASLAGAGGGGYVLALARDEECAERLCTHLRDLNGPGRLQDWGLNDSGLRLGPAAAD